MIESGIFRDWSLIGWLIDWLMNHSWMMDWFEALMDGVRVQGWIYGLWLTDDWRLRLVHSIVSYDLWLVDQLGPMLSDLVVYVGLPGTRGVAKKTQHKTFPLGFFLSLFCGYVSPMLGNLGSHMGWCQATLGLLGLQLGPMLSDLVVYVGLPGTRGVAKKTQHKTFPLGFFLSLFCGYVSPMLGNLGSHMGWCQGTLGLTWAHIRGLGVQLGPMLGDLVVYVVQLMQILVELGGACLSGQSEFQCLPSQTQGLRGEGWPVIATWQCVSVSIDV